MTRMTQRLYCKLCDYSVLIHVNDSEAKISKQEKKIESHVKKHHRWRVRRLGGGDAWMQLVNSTGEKGASWGK
ncbi:MAG: hypothetical protein KGI71_04620 [Patescibacteria group bacterium]|nr:hypothetical protein [Nitrososphaerota archaeon]MDE2022160.1 hypothetical protein [Patescibacteria group bacterium]